MTNKTDALLALAERMERDNSPSAGVREWVAELRALAVQPAPPAASVDVEAIRLALRAARDTEDGVQKIMTLIDSAGGAKVCTCPSGDGSLRWPCPMHPQTGHLMLSDLAAAIARAEALFAAGKRVTDAFRAHGEATPYTRNEDRTRSECEAAMLALDAALEQEAGRG